MHLVIETGPLLAPAVAALAVAVWCALVEPYWLFDGNWTLDPDPEEELGPDVVVKAPPRCTCPFGGLHDGLYAVNPACPVHGRG